MRVLVNSKNSSIEESENTISPPISTKISTIEEQSNVQYDLNDNQNYKKRKSWREIVAAKIVKNNQHRQRKTRSSEHQTPVKGHKCQDLCWGNPSLHHPALEFCNETAMHGLKYIVQPKRHIVERIFWLTSFCIGLGLSVWLILDVFRKYKENPIIVSFWPVETLVSEIPFPAITVCNMNKILKSKAKEYIAAAKNVHVTQEGEGQLDPGVMDALTNLYYLNHVCSSSRSFTHNLNLSLGHTENALLDESLLDKLRNFELTSNERSLHHFFRNSTQTCRDMIPFCVWRDNIKNCSTLFRHIETDFGKCCTFNMVPQLLLTTYSNPANASEKSRQSAAEWNGVGSALDMKDLVPKTAEAKEKLGEFPFPRRARSAGKTYGLSILLRPELHEYFCSGSDSIGFMIATHFTTAMPHLTDFGTVVEPNAETFIKVTPDITMADDTIRSLSLKIRKCYLKGEYTLKFYRFYTRENCLDECVTNMTFEQCQCVRYYMTNDGTRELCGPSKLACTENVRRKILNFKEGQFCYHCRPTCTEISYSTRTTYTPLQNASEILGSSDGQTLYRNASIVHLFFSEQSFYPKIRKELFGITDLTASVGGLLGLCLGFSALSAVELIYFLTIRPWTKHRREFIRKSMQSVWNKFSNKSSIMKN